VESRMKKACFLDRDGVIIRDADYLASPDQVELFPGTAEALRLLKQHDYCLIVISNQSGVARGYFSEQDVNTINNRIDELLKPEKINIDAYYFCPHHPDGSISGYNVDCECRKPKPGMFLQAAREMSVDLSQSLMIGDKVSDIQAGTNAGCKLGVMVRTGHGQEQISSHNTNGIIIRNDILDAVSYILEI